MTQFDISLRRALMDANLAQFENALLRAESMEPDFSPRYLRERMRLLADPWGWMRRRSRTRGKRLNWRLIAIAAALLLLSACAYAVATGQFARWFPGMRMDPEAPEVSEEIVSRMGTVIGQSQTVDGVTVTVNAAVWDGQWLNLSLTAEGPDFPVNVADELLYDLECRVLLAEEQREDYLRKAIEASYIVSHIDFTEEMLEEDLRSDLELPYKPDFHPGFSVAGQEGDTVILQVGMGLFNYVENPVLTLHIENLCYIEKFNLDNGEFHGFSATVNPDGTVETDAGLGSVILTGPYDFTFTLDTMMLPISYGADLDITYENIPMQIKDITVTPFQVRANYEIMAQVDMSPENPDPDKLSISLEQNIAMSLNGLWLENGEYVECMGGATMFNTPDGRAEGEMISTLDHLADPAAVTAVKIGETRVELSKLEVLSE